MSKRIWKRAGVWAAIALIGLLAAISSAGAARSASADRVQPQPVSNDMCLGCHNDPALTKQLSDGSPLSLYVNPADHAGSVHGQSGLACVQCHTNFDQAHAENPVQSPGLQATDRREASLKLVSICATCHADQSAKANDSVHTRAQAAGNRNAAICTDCHTAHTVRRLIDPVSKQPLADARVWIPQTCAQCHSAIFDQYRSSVHGAALIDEHNVDVPTCTTCHGVHTMADPTTAAFRLKSPALCATCHENAALMTRYGISTQVVQTYVADFHGTTVTLFQKESPDGATNKAVCVDCHGVHDIVSTQDPVKGLQVRQNILAKCQQCHPNATANFSSAWLSHYIPSPDKYPVVYFVDLFYKFFIPGVLGSMAFLVVLDAATTARKRFKRSTPPISPTANLPSIDRDKIGFDAKPDQPGSDQEADRG